MDVLWEVVGSMSKVNANLTWSVKWNSHWLYSTYSIGSDGKRCIIQGLKLFLLIRFRPSCSSSSWLRISFTRSALRDDWKPESVFFLNLSSEHFFGHRSNYGRKWRKKFIISFWSRGILPKRPFAEFGKLYFWKWPIVGSRKVYY